jgi:hypothetical protein
VTAWDVAPHLEVFWVQRPARGWGWVNGLAMSSAANKEAKGMPTFRLHNNANILKSQPKKLVE